MITLGGGQLTALNLRFELEVPREVVSETWTLGEIRPGESVRFDSCALTINNASESGAAYHPDVAFFEVRAVPGPGLMAAQRSAGAAARGVAAAQKLCRAWRGDIHAGR